MAALPSGAPGRDDRKNATPNTTKAPTQNAKSSRVMRLGSPAMRVTAGIPAKAHTSRPAARSKRREVITECRRTVRACRGILKSPRQEEGDKLEQLELDGSARG